MHMGMNPGRETNCEGITGNPHAYGDEPQRMLVDYEQGK